MPAMSKPPRANVVSELVHLTWSFEVTLVRDTAIELDRDFLADNRPQKIAW